MSAGFQNGAFQTDSFQLDASSIDVKISWVSFEAPISAVITPKVLSIKIYRNSVWNTIPAKIYKNGIWNSVVPKSTI